MAFKDNSEFEFNFSNSRNYEKFWIKVPNIMKKCLIFRSNFFFNICFKSTKKLYKMATLTFPLGDQIFFICSLKNHMKWFSDFWSKIIRNISKIFLISTLKIFKLIFLKSLAENIGNGYLHYI